MTVLVLDLAGLRTTGDRDPMNADESNERAPGLRRKTSLEVVVPPYWLQVTPSLYRHSSGVRIERKRYGGREGWVLMPVELNRPVIEFPPNITGLEKAFATFAKGCLHPGEWGTTPPVRESGLAPHRGETDSETPFDEEEGEDD